MRELGNHHTGWENPADLIQHIVTIHRRFVREHQPILKGWLDKLAATHGERHPDLFEIRAVFESLSARFLQHMIKEENILFPFIQSLWAAKVAGGAVPGSPFGTILNPIRVMEEEHQEAGAHLARLRQLTGGL